MPEEAPQNKIIGLPEMIFVTLLVGTEEFIEVIILVITLGTGIIVVEIMNGATAALMEMYMLLRGGTGVKRLLIQPLGAFFDGLLGTILPIKTLATVIGIWMINNSEKIEKITGPAGQIITSGGKGVVATGARSATVAASAQTAATTTAAEGRSAVNASAARQRMQMPMRKTGNVPSIGGSIQERREANELQAAELRRKIAMGE